MRTLVAGFGNVLRGDDGFGVAVIHRLQADGARPEGVELMEVGIGGLRMAQELLAGYDRLVVVDAMSRGGPPGTCYLLEVQSVERVAQVDLHLAVPSRALSVAQALGVLPAQVYLVGCEPLEVEEFCMQLSPPVAAAVDEVVRRIHGLLRDPTPKPEAMHP